jgi:DNA-binding XRE family transcriptional regulator
MSKHRIKEIRQRKKVSQERLGALIGRDKWFIYRLETGGQKLDLEIAQKIADALDVTLAEVVGVASAKDNGGNGALPSVGIGMSEDVTAYEPAPGDPLSAHVGDNRYLYRVDTDVLDLSGIRAGDIVVVDGGAEACAMRTPLQPVRVRYHPAGQFMEPISLLRLLVPPRLLITNGSRANHPSLDMERDDAHIVGVVTAVHRRLG